MVTQAALYQLPDQDWSRSWQGNRNFRSHVLSLQRAKVPYMEPSLPGTFILWNSRSQELSFPGTFAPQSENEAEFSLLPQLTL